MSILDFQFSNRIQRCQCLSSWYTQCAYNNILFNFPSIPQLLLTQFLHIINMRKCILFPFALNMISKHLYCIQHKIFIFYIFPLGLYFLIEDLGTRTISGSPGVLVGFLLTMYQYYFLFELLFKGFELKLVLFYIKCQIRFNIQF